MTGAHLKPREQSRREAPEYGPRGPTGQVWNNRPTDTLMDSTSETARDDFPLASVLLAVMGVPLGSGQVSTKPPSESV
jgi:hypothetical protein